MYTSQPIVDSHAFERTDSMWKSLPEISHQGVQPEQRISEYVAK